MSTAKQRAYNKSVGLPENWVPPQFYGPGNGKTKTTPKGIALTNWNWEKEKWPVENKGYKVRLVLSEFDDIWTQVRQQYHGENVPDNFPKVIIWPTIQWSEQHGFYLGGVCLNQKECYCTLWYKSATGSHAVSNWEGYAYHEMSHVLGVPDPASEKLSGVTVVEPGVIKVDP